MANGNGNGKSLPKGTSKAQAGKPKSWLQNAGGKVGGAIASYARKQAGVAPPTKMGKLKSMRDKAKGNGKNGNGNGS